jgi:hypothetical protein
MDIVLIANGIRILPDVIIVNSIRANLVSRATSYWGVITTIATQAKIVSYRNHHRVAPMADWVLRLSVGLGLTSHLTLLMTYIGARSEGLRKGAQRNVLGALTTQNKQIHN